MKIALISDIHGNLPALEAVLADLDHRGLEGGRSAGGGSGSGPDGTGPAGSGLAGAWHLGDLVGYAPWPNEVVALVAERGIDGVAGNYDSTVATDYKHCGCRYEDPRQEELSHLSYGWTREHVSAATKAALGRLPFRIDLRPFGGHQAGPTVILVHGAPTLNTLYWTEDRPDTFAVKMAERAGARPGDVLAFGHTHLPWHRVIDGVHFVNTGSVGRPKDGDWRAGYAILDLGGEAPAVEFVRVAYDLDRATTGIRASTLPDDFAAYLETGGRPSEAPGT